MKKHIFLASFLFICIFATSQTLNLLPTIPEPATNPHLATAFNGVKTGTLTYAKTVTQSDEMLLAAMAYLHPSSPYKNQQPILDRLNVLLDSVFSGWNSGKLPVNDMMFSFHSAVSYLMLKQYKPTAIPVGKQTLWEAAIRKNIDAIVAATPNVYSKKIVGSLWLNGDLRRCLGVYFGALALNDTVLAPLAKNIIEDVMTKTLLGDGGTHYVGYDTEASVYHGEITMRGFLWYYILTRSQVVKDFICATNNYIPLIQIPMGSGFKEWISCPSDKAYYNQTPLTVEALAKAYLNGDPYNYQIGKGAQNLYLAFLYRSGLTGKVVPDNYMLYDKNHMGPRGRWGNWGVIGKTRDSSNPSPELTETTSSITGGGTNTFVGAFTLNLTATSTTYPLNAAFQGTAPQVKFATGVENDWQRGNKWALLSGKKCNNALTRTHTIYGLSASFTLSKKNFVSVGWNAMEQWVVTPDRLIGMVEVEATTASTVYGFAQRIQLVSGRMGQVGARKLLNFIDENSYEYGDLRVKVIDKNYLGTVDTLYHGVNNGVGDNYAVMLLLNDVKSGGDVANVYPVGTRRYAFIEVTNKDRVYSTNPTRLTLDAGLEGFEFQESAGRKIRMVHNTAGTAVSISATSMICPFSKVRVIKSWDETALTALPVVSGVCALSVISIPAYGHLMVVNSDLVADHSLGYNTYDSVYNPVKATTDLMVPISNSVFVKTLEVVDGRLHLPKELLEGGKLAISFFNAEGLLTKSISTDGFSSVLDADFLMRTKGVSVMKVKSEWGEVSVYKLLRR
jgi:hypothetical protein